MSRSYIALAAAAALGFGAAGSANAVELLQNGGFETGDLSFWTPSNQTDPITGDGDQIGWGFALLGAPAVNGPNPPGPFATSAAGGSGTFYALTDPGAPGAHALTQSFTVSAGSTVILKFVMFANDQSGNGPLGDVLDFTVLNNQQERYNQHVQVDILSDAADPLSTDNSDVVASLINTFVDLGPNPHDFTSYSFDITPFVGAGGTFQIRFGEVDTMFPIHAGVDDVSIDATASTAAPEPATMAVLGIGLAALGLMRRRRS